MIVRISTVEWRESGGSRNKVEFNDLLYFGRVTDEERAEWCSKRGQMVKSEYKTQKSFRELRKDYVKILENRRREAEKARGTLPDRQERPCGP